MRFAMPILVAALLGLVPTLRADDPATPPAGDAPAGTATPPPENGGPHHPSPAALFKRFDTDGNGVISLDEWLAGIQAMHHHHHHHGPDDAPPAGGDGTPPPPPPADGATSPPPPPPGNGPGDGPDGKAKMVQRLTDIYNAANVDGKGLDQAEFVAALKALHQSRHHAAPQ
jgi:hypothetical protein